jgi:predicted ATP-grasp superfamily ATP-dependent carboligase
VTTRALVVEEGRTRGALAAVRALRAAGWAVGVGCPGGRGIAASSRAVTLRHDVPPPAEGVGEFVDAVRRAVDAGRYDVVLAAGDAELLAIAYGAERIGAAVPHPGYDVVLRAVDKLALSTVADAAGLGAPRTDLATPDVLASWRGRAVIKPRWHWRPDRPQAGSRCEAVVVPDAVAAAEAAGAMRAAGAEPVIQEHVEGELIAFACVVDDGGALVGSVQQRATRIWPAVAGVSVRAETVAVDPVLEGRVTALLRELGWRGIAEVQLLQRAGSDPVLIDLNGRIYGSLALAVSAGVNIPALGAAVAAGLQPRPAPAARVGCRYLWLEGELRAVRAGGAGPVGPAIVDAMRWARGSVGGVWDGRDPRPGAQQLRDLARRAVTRGPR